MHFYPSRAKLAGLFALTCLMVGLCLACTRQPDVVPRVVGWFGAGFFGLAFLVIPRRLLARGPLVTIDAVGIDDRRLGVGVIPWEAIDAVWTNAVQGSRFLCLGLADPEPYRARLPRRARAFSRMNARLGFGDIAIGFIDLTPGLDAAWRHIQGLNAGAASGPPGDEP